MHAWSAKRQEARADDRLVEAAVLQQLTVIGDGAGGVAADIRARHPGVPWPRLEGARDVAVHAYFAVDWPTVWRITDASVPDLTAMLLTVLDDAFPEEGRRLRADS